MRTEQRELLTFSPYLGELIDWVKEVGVLENKKLWLIPTWECNRSGNPCGICFSYSRLQDAQEKGYLNAGNDFLEKVKALSVLPWEEVIITGGEPTTRPSLLREVLANVHPERTIRIISNGDFAEDEGEREKIAEIIRESGRQVQVDISAHDKGGFLKRIHLLGKEGIPVGAQLREGERNTGVLKSVLRTRSALRRFLGREETPIEEHKVLRMGNAAEMRQAIILRLDMLRTYTAGRNQGIYLYPGLDGVKVTANHETPYLLGDTPADIARGGESAEETLERICEFYLGYLGLFERRGLTAAEEEVEYIKACWRTGVPLWIYFHFINSSEREIAEVYFKEIAENSEISVTELRQYLTGQLARELIKISNERGGMSIREPLRNIGLKMPKTPEALAETIRNSIFWFYGRLIIKEVRFNPSNFRERIGYLSKENTFQRQLSIFGISMEDLLKALGDILGTEYDKDRPLDHLPETPVVI